ncbi:chorismate mutase [Streptococcus sp. zg-JUN1979]|uniref:chorismate mutase n=1 Tax=Streptococcus sp. zg-JUN1979 TaxID=3391450 RepID=UPI0039A5F086
MALTEIRREIDRIDKDLVALLEERMRLVDKVVTYKKAHQKAVFDAKRESLVLEKVSECVIDKQFEKAIVDTFSDMMKHSRAYQDSQLTK